MPPFVPAVLNDNDPSRLFDKRYVFRSIQETQSVACIYPYPYIIHPVATIIHRSKEKMGDAFRIGDTMMQRVCLGQKCSRATLLMRPF